MGWPFRAAITDNGGELRAHAFRRTLEELGVEHRFIRSGRPQTNGCVERLQGTILQECYKPAFAQYFVPGYQGLQRDLERYLIHCNTDHAHTGRWTRGRTPAQVIGATKMYSGR